MDDVKQCTENITIICRSLQKIEIPGVAVSKVVSWEISAGNFWKVKKFPISTLHKPKNSHFLAYHQFMLQNGTKWLLLLLLQSLLVKC